MTGPRRVDDYRRSGRTVSGYTRGGAKPRAATLADGSTARTGSVIRAASWPGPVVGDPDGDGDNDLTAAGQADDANPAR